MWFGLAHRQGSNDGKVNSCQRFCLPALWNPADIA
jgi:hypothetical protein